MSLTSNFEDVAFTTTESIDKIVKVFTGNYTAADLTTRVGNLDTAYIFTIPHGLSRPVFCELLWSVDGGTTWVDGGVLDAATVQAKLAFSDNTNIYILDSLAGPTASVLYKVYCSWIDDFDTTNPLVDVAQFNSAPTQFDSRLNYQKIFRQGVLTYSPGTFGVTEVQTVAHSLGYSPNAKVWFEAFTGEIWPLIAGGNDDPFLYSLTQDECRLSIDDTKITVSLDKFSNATHRAWYKIYYDAT